MIWAYMGHADYYLRRNKCSRYVHANTVSVYWQDHIGILDCDMLWMEDCIESYRNGLCHQLFKDLQTEYEYRLSSECLMNDAIETERDFASCYDLSGNLCI